MKAKKSSSPSRSTYRHGKLKQALLEAGIALAREHGPAGVVLREATRRAGVAPNAAYRHYAGQPDLLDAVRAASLSEAARTMESELASLGPSDSSPAYARNSLRAVGRGYLRFAMREPGLFRTAFVIPFSLEQETTYSRAGPSGMDPFQILGMALDRMLAAGLLWPEARPQAEFLAWSAVHGMALMMLDGPLRGYSGAALDDLSDRLFTMVERGISH